jgi:3-oxoacyl-[acyl-carrier-protein] synthase-1
MSTHPESNPPPLAILATRVASFAGDTVETLHAAVSAAMGGMNFQPASVYAVGDGYAEASPVLAAPMALQGTTRAQCLSELLLKVLAPLISQLPQEDTPPPHVSLLLPLDAERHIRALDIDFESIRRSLCQVLPGLADDRVELVPYHQGATAALLGLRQRLAEEPAGRAILCGADSLINMLTYQALAEAGTLATENHGSGIVPGEGAAAILLQRQDRCRPQGQPCLANISGLASAPEPEAGHAGHRPMNGLAQALRQATATQPALLNQAATLLLGHALGEADDLEWHQTERQLWPIRLEESQRVAMMLGEVDAPTPEAADKPRLFNLAQATGETGAAALPLQLAVACEQFRFEARLARFGHPSPRPVLVAETGDYPVRGAICLQPPAKGDDAAPSNKPQGNPIKER